VIAYEAGAGHGVAASSLHQAITDRFRSVDGQQRLSRALYSIAVDVVYPQARYDLRPDDYEWLITAVAHPVDSGTRAALEVLAEELSDVLVDAPRTLLDDLQRLKDRASLGME
jgi:hypothetical protein